MISTPLIRVQGRSFSTHEFGKLQKLIDTHPEWSRHRIARELCGQWEWRTPLGQLKTFAARSLLLKLAQRYELRLPAVRTACRRAPWGLSARAQSAAAPPPPVERIESGLASLRPLRWRMAPYGAPERGRALAYLREYHYLGCNRPVGTHLLYLVQDVRGHDLAVHLVGAAAWRCAARDVYLGWSAAGCAAGLPRLANHSRFLIFPWVRVPHLASHLLGALTRRIAADWRQQHGWPLELLESFVETGRFTGAAYRAANWQLVGQTTGRTRQEKRHRPEAPPKSVWVYPLHPRFREHLGGQMAVGGAQ
jgi:hypothetical protein